MLLKTPETLTIGDMAAQSGLSEHTLRYYERIGLIQRIPRDNSSGHRRYSLETAQMVESLAYLRATGMPLEEMRTILFLYTRNPVDAGEMKAQYAAHKATIEKEMERQQRRLGYLNAKIAYWAAVEAGDAIEAERISELFPELAKQLNT